MATETIKDSHALGAGRSAGKTSSSVLERRSAIKKLLPDNEDTLYVTGLAGAKGDVLVLIGADNPRVYPLGGAMGAATGMALGLALAQPDKRVVCVTGDGELLMNVGTLATIGILNPPNLSIVCVDNEHYGETGFQPSHTGQGVDLAKIAEGSGIQAVRTVVTEADMADATKVLFESNATSFVLMKVGVSDPPAPYRTRDASYNKSVFRKDLLGKV
ncbi:MAG: aldehyde dehydrogenase [Alphaproteobacteria bacterium]|nr:aldehyde dehydrogenase [Alphaproteobacteria bacterium]